MVAMPCEDLEFLYNTSQATVNLISTIMVADLLKEKEYMGCTTSVRLSSVANPPCSPILRP